MFDHIFNILGCVLVDFSTIACIVIHTLHAYLVVMKRGTCMYITQYRFTALILAAASGRTDCVRLLLEAKADTEIKDYVRSLKHPSVIRQLGRKLLTF